MSDVVQSRLFGELREHWPQRPYPLLVDHLDQPDGRICPAGSLYVLGKIHGDRLKRREVAPGEVVACFPKTWIEWVGMMLGCLRRGAVFAPALPGCLISVEEHAEAVGARWLLTDAEERPRKGGRYFEPHAMVLGPPAIAVLEDELMESTAPAGLGMAPELPVWLDPRLCPVAVALSVIGLLRCQVELHLGLSAEDSLRRAEPADWFFDGAGSPIESVDLPRA